ncbi:MAG: hypothetical protein ACRCYR_09820, partial [Phycicoccus sp.]
WLAMSVLRGRPLLGTGPRPWRDRATWRTVLVVAAVGLGGVYYAGFTLLLLVVATVLARALHRPRAWRRGATVTAAVGSVALVPLALARLAAPADIVGATPAARGFFESETHAGKLVELVLPREDHRVALLAQLRWAYHAVVTPPTEPSALGVVAVAGLAVLTAAAVVALAGGRRATGDLLPWSALAAVSFAFYTVGGAGVLVALFGTPQLRAWGRWWVYLMAFGLLAVGHLVTRLVRRRRRLGAAVAAALVVLGWFDQTSPAVAPDHPQLQARIAALDTHVGEISRAVEPGCAVFQLPVRRFPEPVALPSMAAYDALLPYLVSRELRWSTGAMAGTREADWQRGLPVDRPADLAADLAALGFCAVQVDEDGYRDADGRVARSPVAALRTALGAPVSTLPGESLVAFRVPPATDDARRRAVLAPVVVSVDGYAPESVDGVARQPVAPSAAVRVANLGTTTGAGVDVELVLEGRGPRDRRVVVRDADGTILARATLRPGARSTVAVRLDTPPGETRLAIAVDGDPVESLVPRRLVTADLVELRASASDPTVRVRALLAEGE